MVSQHRRRNSRGSARRPSLASRQSRHCYVLVAEDIVRRAAGDRAFPAILLLKARFEAILATPPDEEAVF